MSCDVVTRPGVYAAAALSSALIVAIVRRLTPGEYGAVLPSQNGTEGLAY